MFKTECVSFKTLSVKFHLETDMREKPFLATKLFSCDVLVAVFLLLCPVAGVIKRGN